MLTYLIVTYLAALFSHKPPVPTYPAPMIRPEVLEQVKGFTVLISNEGWEGISRGTGVLIDSTHVLTCAHMISRGSQPWVYTYPLGRVITGKRVVWMDQSHDVAIFELNVPVKCAHYAVFNTTATIGQPVVVIGNTLGAMVWFTSYGIISDKWGFYDLTTATIHGGNSGGPWGDLSGRVVALTDWGLQDRKGHEEQINGGINAQELVDDIKAWQHPKKSYGPSNGELICK